MIAAVVFAYAVFGLATAHDIMGVEKPTGLGESLLHATATLGLAAIWPALWVLVLGYALYRETTR